MLENIPLKVLIPLSIFGLIGIILTYLNEFIGFGMVAITMFTFFGLTVYYGGKDTYQKGYDKGYKEGLEDSERYV